MWEQDVCCGVLNIIMVIKTIFQNNSNWWTDVFSADFFFLFHHQSDLKYLSSKRHMLSRYCFTNRPD